MLTHYPETPRPEGDGVPAAGGELAERVVLGELVSDSEICCGVLRSADTRTREAKWCGPHHALGRYLTDEERRTVGTRFDTYV